VEMYINCVEHRVGCSLYLIFLVHLIKIVCTPFKIHSYIDIHMYTCTKILIVILNENLSSLWDV